VFWNCAFWVSCSILKTGRYRILIRLVLYRIIITILCYQIYKNYGTHMIKSHFKYENGSSSATTLTIKIMPCYLFKFLSHFSPSISLYVLDTFKLRKERQFSFIIDHELMVSWKPKYYLFFLWRYNWHNVIFKFQVYNIVIPYLYMLQNKILNSKVNLNRLLIKAVHVHFVLLCIF